MFTKKKKTTLKRLNFEGNKNKFKIDDTIIMKTTLFYTETNALKQHTTVNRMEDTKCDNQINTLTTIKKY